MSIILSHSAALLSQNHRNLNCVSMHIFGVQYAPNRQRRAKVLGGKIKVLGGKNPRGQRSLIAKVLAGKYPWGKVQGQKSSGQKSENPMLPCASMQKISNKQN